MNEFTTTTQETSGDSWSDVTSHQSSTTRSTWLGVAEAGTLKLHFGVEKWRNRKIIFGTFIYVLWSYQNRKHPVGHIDTLTWGWFYSWLRSITNIANYKPWLQSWVVLFLTTLLMITSDWQEQQTKERISEKHLSAVNIEQKTKFLLQLTLKVCDF